MKKIFVIALVTCKESFRSKLLNILLFFGLISVACTRFFTFFAPGEELKIIQDTSLGVIRFLGMLITVFIAGSALPREMQRKTITSILSKPVHRFQYILGKFCGGLYVIFFNLLAMGALLGLIVFIKSGSFNPNLLKALLLIAAELTVLCSITLCISTFSSEIFSIVSGVIFFIIGHLAHYLQHMADRFDSMILKGVLISLYTVLPNFEYFNVHGQVVLGADITTVYIGKVLSYGILYCAIMLIIGYLFFAEREI